MNNRRAATSRRNETQMIEQDWNTIESWLQSTAKPDFTFPTGVTPAQWDAAEETLSVTFPEDFKAAYQIHNGSQRVGLFDYGYLLPLFIPETLSKRERNAYREIITKWTWYREYLEEGLYDDLSSSPEDPTHIKSDHWNRRWIPITDNDAGDQLCLDLDPGPEGASGQIIFWDHEVGATQVIANSFENLLAEIANRVMADRCEFDKTNFGTIQLKSD